SERAGTGGTGTGSLDTDSIYVSQGYPSQVTDEQLFGSQSYNNQGYGSPSQEHLYNPHLVDSQHTGQLYGAPEQGVGQNSEHFLLREVEDEAESLDLYSPASPSRMAAGSSLASSPPNNQ